MSDPQRITEEFARIHVPEPRPHHGLTPLQEQVMLDRFIANKVRLIARCDHD